MSDIASPSKTRTWIAAARPRTLLLAIASVAMGVFLAVADGVANALVAMLCLLTAFLLQILSNLANDYGDSKHGADSDNRAGPQRAVQTGLLSARSMKRGMVFVASLTMVSGTALVWLAFGVAALPLALIFLVVGAAAIWAALAYTASDRPYGYVGLGDIFVLIFFGWVAVCGTYFAQALTWKGAILLPATSCGLLAVAVLNINNIRDIESDHLAGKRTLPVRLGRRRATFYHWMLLSGAQLLALGYVVLEFNSWWQLLFLVSVPLFIFNGRAVARAPSPKALDPLLKQMSISTLAFVLTFGLGQIL